MRRRCSFPRRLPTRAAQTPVLGRLQTGPPIPMCASTNARVLVLVEHVRIHVCAQAQGAGRRAQGAGHRAPGAGRRRRRRFVSTRGCTRAQTRGRARERRRAHAASRPQALRVEVALAVPWRSLSPPLLGRMCLRSGCLMVPSQCSICCGTRRGGRAIRRHIISI